MSVVAAGCDEGEKKKTAVSACAVSPSSEQLQARGEVAFARNHRAGSELVAVDTRTQQLRTITPQKGPHYTVSWIAWSHASKTLAFSAGDYRYSGDIWVKSATTGHARRLTNAPEDDVEPSWSPDGRRIVFERYDNGDWSWIYVIDADGNGLRRITPPYDWSPVWMPDGRISYVNPGGVWVMNADGSGKRRIAHDEVSPTGYPAAPDIAWSPDATRVAFTTNTALWVMKSDGTGRRKLHDGPGSAREPTWSPDGRRIAWTKGDGDLEIFVVNRDGSQLRNVTDNERAHDHHPSRRRTARAGTERRATC